MFLKYLVLFCVLAAAACNETPAIPTPTITPAPTPTEEPRLEDYIEVQAEGVRLGVEVPWGWKARETEHGLFMIERRTSVEMLMGMQVNIFVHPMGGFDIPTSDDANIALSVLDQIIRDPGYLGQAAASEPQGFNWDGHDAAYYLLNTGDGNVTMLVAVTIHSPDRLVVCNISSPKDRSQSIRVMLPNLLGSLTINGATMNLDAVNALPNPLVFPVYEPKPESTPEPANW